jgi:FtsZ-binding cell division protein ZapB
MMQPSQVKDYFPEVKRNIDQATQLCQITSDIPDDVRSFLSELDREANHAMEVLEEENNDNKILQCIDRLEKLGDQARDACASVEVNQQVENAVRQAHDAISALKHQLH